MNSNDKLTKIIETLNTLNYKIVGDEEKIVDLVRGTHFLNKRRKLNLLIKKILIKYLD